VRGLSTGNRRKVALVGALMSRPELVVLDEPTNGLDPLVQNEFMSILEEVTAAGTSVLLSSHILGEVERIADRVAVIRGGVIVADGPTAQLRKGTAQVFRAVFAGEAPEPSVFSRLEGAVAVSSPQPRELLVQWSGPPRELLATLAGYELESLTAPEPDLETAFMSYYGDAEGSAS
jgi:ABC-2 type transport system ATP-binding protein